MEAIISREKDRQQATDDTINKLKMWIAKVTVELTNAKLAAKKSRERMKILEEAVDVEKKKSSNLKKNAQRTLRMQFIKYLAARG